MHAPLSAFFGTRVSSQASPHDRGTLYLAFLRNPNHKAEDYAAALRRLEFPAGGSSLYALAKVPANPAAAGAGTGAVSCRVAARSAERSGRYKGSTAGFDLLVVTPDGNRYDETQIGDWCRGHGL